MLLLNSPHNPTGRVLTRAELELIAAVCVEHDLICISDEVYEHLVFDGEHIPPATLPGMAEPDADDLERRQDVLVHRLEDRLVLGTGRAGRRHARGQAVPDVRRRHAAAARRRRCSVTSAERDRDPARRPEAARRDQLCAGLDAAGLRPLVPAGTYFVNADVGEDAIEFCASLPERCGVVAIPMAAFYDDKDAASTLVRFAFCKRGEVIAEAARRLASLS